MIKLPNRIVTVNRTPVFFGKDIFPAIDRMVGTLRPSGIFIMVDQNTREHCLPMLRERSSSFANAQLLEIGGGEDAKSIETAQGIWNQLMASGAGRNSLLVNLGGGVVSDLGGFVAAGYQRGIRYINIPTSLMGQADAAIGGKTAVNMGSVKNQVGFFYAASGVFISTEFLGTLPEAELRSGFAEIIKSVLISNGRLWRRLQKHPVGDLLKQPVDGSFWQELILSAIAFKNRVVVKDYREANLRKVLNFGHTLGHGFETFSLQHSKMPLLHGEAVAAGMICAAFLSVQKTGLPQADMEAIVTYIHNGFSSFRVESSSRSQLMEIVLHDKKMKAGGLRFTLLSTPGCPVADVPCDEQEIMEAIDFYNSLSK